MTLPRHLMGVETEYAVAGYHHNGNTIRKSTLTGYLMAEAAKRIPHLAAVHGGGLFLENGGLLYVDTGSHPEMCTPECDNPSDLVRYIQAGDRILRGIADRLEADHKKVARVFLTRCNVDYSGSQSTWACHESYAYQGDFSAIPDQLIPHLVSRIIYSGSGGFDCFSPGISFSLSPRVSHIMAKVSENSTSGRGIVHTKNEPLCAGYHRLHLVCGESVCSETASWLKHATTAIVVAMIDGGLSPGNGVRLSSPLDALRTIAGDPTCERTVEAEGGEMTAVAIQRHYLQMAESHLDHPAMPSWATETCVLWRGVLNALERSVDELSTTLDWTIKKGLYHRRAKRAGIAWETLPYWNQILEKIRWTLGKLSAPPKRTTVEEVLGSSSPIADTIRSLTPYLERTGLSWDGLRPVVDLRKELFEIETRFSELGANGIFARLDRAGVLDHHLPSIRGVDRAVTNPPRSGRAHIRGRVVKRIAKRGTTRDLSQCEWDRIWDWTGKKMLDLADPFEEREKWRETRRAEFLRRRVIADL